MQKKRPPALLSGALIAFALLPPSGALAGGLPDQQPNIVFILLDDLDASVTPFWDAMPRTEQLIRERGVSFSESFAPMPICCPSRAGSLTGKYAHNNGVFTNGGDYGGWSSFVQPLDGDGAPLLDIYGDPLNNEEHTFARHLQDAGYRTVLLGKYLNGIEDAPDHIPPGWSEWYGGVDHLLYEGYLYTLLEWDGDNPSRQVRYGIEESDYQTDVLRRKTIDFIQRAETNDDQPFFVYLAPTAPHLPLRPAPRHKEEARIWRDQLPKTPNYFEGDISDKPRWLRMSGHKRGSAIYRLWAQADFWCRMGTLYAVDEMVDEIIATLDILGELENTFIVFTSDNGYNNGSHRLVHKMAPYEESIRVPLVIAGPGIDEPYVQTTTALAIDLAPTFLDMAGLDIPADMDGGSLLPFLGLGQKPEHWHSDFIVQYKAAGALNGIGAEIPDWFWYHTLAIDVPSHQALRNETHTYIEWYDDSEWFGLHARELYDLVVDPYQLNNLLAEDGAGWKYGGLVWRYSNRLAELAGCKGEDCRTESAADLRREQEPIDTPSLPLEKIRFPL